MIRKENVDYGSVLEDFIATTNKKPNATDAELFKLFPEFDNNKDVLDAAWAYRNTRARGGDLGEVRSKFPEFFPITEGNIDALSGVAPAAPTPQVEQVQSTTTKQTPNLLQTIGNANNAGMVATGEYMRKQDQQEQARVEERKQVTTATLPMSEADKALESEISAIRNKPSANILLLTEYQENELRLGPIEAALANPNAERIKELEGRRSTYMQEPKSENDAYQKYVEAYLRNTEDGRRVVREADAAYNEALKNLQNKFNNSDDLKAIIADIQARYNSGALTEEQANKELNDRANQLFKEKYGAILQEEYNTLINGAYEHAVKNDNGWLKQQHEKFLDKSIKELDKEIDDIDKDSQHYDSSTIGNQFNPMTMQYEPMVATRTPEARNLDAARTYLRDAKELVEAVKENKGFFPGLGTTLSKGDTWDLGFSSLINNGSLLSTIEKLEKYGDESLTKDEQALLDASAQYMAVAAYYSDKLGRGYKAGQTTGASIPFMLEFMATPISSIENGAIRGLLKWGMKRLGSTAKTKGGRIAGRMAEAFLKDVFIGAPVMTVTWGAPNIAAGTLERMTGVTLGKEDENGVIRYDNRVGQQQFAEALRNAGLDTYIENYSEMYGNAFAPLAGLKQVKTVAKAIGKVKGTDVGRIITTLKSQPWVRDIASKAQFHGYLGETSEEVVGGLLRWATMSDVNSARDAGLDKDGMIDIMLGLAPTSLLFGGLGVGSAIVHRHSVYKNAAEYRQTIQDETERQAFDDMMNASDYGEFHDKARANIESILLNPNFTPEQKKEKLKAHIDAAQEYLSTREPNIAAEQAKQEAQSHAHKDGNVYFVTVGGQNAYVIDGNIAVDYNEDPTNPVFTMSQSVPENESFVVRFEDGTVKQVGKSDIETIVSYIPVNEHVEDLSVSAATKASVLANIHVGDRISIPGYPESSEVVAVAEDGSWVAILVEGVAEPVKIDAAMVMENFQPAAPEIEQQTPEQPTADNVIEYTNENGDVARFVKNEDGTYSPLNANGEKTQDLTQEQFDGMVEFMIGQGYTLVGQQAPIQEQPTVEPQVQTQPIQEQQQVGEQDIALQRLNSGKRVRGARMTRTLPSGEVIHGHLELISANQPTPSHDPLNGYQSMSGYPVNERGENINDRDYEHDENEQNKVQEHGDKFNAEAIDYIPVLDKKGRVLDGNGRIQSRMVAAKQKTDKAYLDGLRDNIERFGMTEEDLNSVENPTLVFIVDDEIEADTQTLAMFNQDERQAQDPIAEAASYTRKLTPIAVEHITDAISTFSNTDQFLNDDNVIKGLINQLVDDGIISDRQVPSFFQKEKVTPKGKSIIKAILFGTAFDSETIRIIMSDASVESKVAKALPQIITCRSLGEYAIFDEINNSIKLYAEWVKYGKSHNLGKKNDFMEYVNQTAIDVDVAANRYSPLEITLCSQLAYGGVNTYRDFLNTWIDRANLQTGNTSNLFEETNKQTLINEILQHYGTTKKNETTTYGRNGDRGAVEKPAVQPTDVQSGTEQESSPEPTASVEPKVETPQQPVEPQEPKTTQQQSTLTAEQINALDMPDDLKADAIAYIEGENTYATQIAYAAAQDALAKTREAGFAEAGSILADEDIQAGLAEFADGFKEYTDNVNKPGDIAPVTIIPIPGMQNPKAREGYAKMLSATKKIGIALVKKGYYEFVAWEKQISIALNNFFAQLKQMAEPWTDENIAQFIKDAWESRVIIDGKTKKLSEFAEEIWKSQNNSVSLQSETQSTQPTQEQPKNNPTTTQEQPGTESRTEEENALREKIRSWLTVENIDFAEGKELNEISEKFGNKPEPIAIIPQIIRQALPTLDTDYLYSGKAYLIDHAANHHPELSIEDYDKIQTILNEYDDIKDVTGKDGIPTIAVIKQIDKGYAIVAELSKEDNRIILHKTFFYRDENGKRTPYKNKPSILEKSSVDGSTTISPNAFASAGRHRNISALDVSDDKGTTNNSNTQIFEQKSEENLQNANKQPEDNAQQEPEVGENEIGILNENDGGWVVSIPKNKRIDRSEFANVAERAESFGGKYVRGVGFVFDNKQDAADFNDTTKEPAKMPGAPADFREGMARAKFTTGVQAKLEQGLESGEKPFKSIVELRAFAREQGMKVDKEGRDDILLQELVEDAIVRAGRKIVNGMRNVGSTNKEIYNRIVALYNIQPTLGRRDSNKIALQQYSTPIPMSFLLDMYAYREEMQLGFEPTAGNGMSVFAIPQEKVDVNEIDENRLYVLKGGRYHQVTEQDATQPFGREKQYDFVVMNPPFGKLAAQEYDGRSINGLAPQIAIKGLDQMKDNGRAAIIIGGNTKYNDDGVLAADKALYSYLYNNYNVAGVVDINGDLYAKEGTSYPVRMILINGRRSEEQKNTNYVYAPTKDKAIPVANTWEELYQTIDKLNNSNQQTNGYEVLHSSNRAEIRQGVSQNIPGRTGDIYNPSGQSNEGGRAEYSMGDTGISPSTESGAESGTNLFGEQSPTGNGRIETGAATPNSRNRNVRAWERRTGDRGNGGGLRGQDNFRDDLIRDRAGALGVNRERTEESKQVAPVRSQLDTKLEDESKSNYITHSSSLNLASVSSNALVDAMDETLTAIEKEVGNIDEFVTNELGYESVEAMKNALAAEQVDTVAAAIYQLKQGQALIIGDQTGIGKGRQMAALIRWARRQGKKPIFMTKNADLFSDLLRDMTDIRSAAMRPLIINANTGENPGRMVTEDKNGESHVIYTSPSRSELASIMESGEIPDDYDYVVLTYSQVNHGDAQTNPDEKNKNTQIKANYIRQISKDNYMFLDESHNASGEIKEDGKGGNTARYMLSIVKDTEGCVFASATFAKRPDSMPLYALKTVLNKANVESRNLIEIVKKGGVVLQEIMSRALAQSGQMFRRERNMDGVVNIFVTESNPEIAKEEREKYNETIKLFRRIIDFQQDYVDPQIEEIRDEIFSMQQTAKKKRGTDKMGVNNAPFANKTYQYTRQLMFALKVPSIIETTIQQIKEGRHPVIGVDQTNETFFNEFANGQELDKDEYTFAANLLRGLEKTLEYSIEDEDGATTHYTFSPSELGTKGEAEYYEIQRLIRESTKDIMISPIDAIIKGLNDAGFSVGEMTGRKKTIKFTPDGRAFVRNREERNKIDTKNAFNRGDIDVVILNKSAATGISLHAKKGQKDTRQRVMIIGQALLDINDYQQLLGRIDRTGQVARGYYINLALPVPAETRLMMMLARKMKSLNANTTSSQTNKSSDIDIPDMLNKYGSKVAVEYLVDNPDVFKTIRDLSDGRIGADNEEELAELEPEDEEFIYKVSSYIALLDVEEQDKFYEDVTKRFLDLMQYLNDTNSNDLEITTMPLNATTLEKRVSSRGTEPNGSNVFAQNAYVEKAEVDVLSRPMSVTEINKTIKSLRYGGVEGKNNLVRQIDKEEADKLGKIDSDYQEKLRKAEEEKKVIREKIMSRKHGTEEAKQQAVDIKFTRIDGELEGWKNLRRATLRNQYGNLRNLVNELEPGGTYLIPDTFSSALFHSSSPAIFLGFKGKESGITQSSTVAVFAVLDSRRRVEVKLSDVTKDKRNVIYTISDFTDQNAQAAQQTTLDNWDSQIPREQRETRYILTGNIIQAYRDISAGGNLEGKLISFTDSDGNVRDGILMPEYWSIMDLPAVGVPINARLNELLENDIDLVSVDKSVKVAKVEGEYRLYVPKTVKAGGKFFKDEEILSYTKSGKFTERGEQFFADIKANKIADLVLKLANMGVRVEDNKTEAQVSDERLDIVSPESTALTEALTMNIEAIGGNVEIETQETADAMEFDNTQSDRIEFMSVWHGSSRNFDKFDLSFIGQGEGGNAFGDGVYVTQLKEIGEYYADIAYDNNKERIEATIDGETRRFGSLFEIASYIQSKHREFRSMMTSIISENLNRILRSIVSGNFETLKENVNNDVVNKYLPENDQRIQHISNKITKDLLDIVSDIKTIKLETSKYLYSCEIPDDTGDNYIGWDERYDKDSYIVRKIANAIKEDATLKDNSEDERKQAFDENISGRTISGEIIYLAVAEYFNRNYTKASEFLNSLGFDGIRVSINYYETGEINDKKNYVIFNPNNVKINKSKNLLLKQKGTVYGWYENGTIHLVEGRLNPNTTLHETTHMLAAIMKQVNPEGWADVVRVCKENTALWDEVINDTNYSDLTTDDAIASEVIARYSGSRGAAKLQAMIGKKLAEEKAKNNVLAYARVRDLFNKVQGALRKFWNWVGTDLFHIKNFKNIDEVADMFLYQALDANQLPTPPRGGKREAMIEKPTWDGKEPFTNYVNRLSDYNKQIKGQRTQDEIEKLVNDYTQQRVEQTGAKEQFERKWLDAALPLRELQDFIVKKGGKLRDEWDAYKTSFLASSKAQTAMRDFEENCMLPLVDIMRRIIKSKKLERGITLRWQNLPSKDIRLEYDDNDKREVGKELTSRELLGVYAQAKDIVEAKEMKTLPDRGYAGFVKEVGVTPEELIKQVEAILTPAEISELWNAIRKATAWGLDYQVSKGFLHPDERALYNRPHYVPERGWSLRDNTGIPTEYTNHGGLYNTAYNSATKKAKGRPSLASDPFAYIESIAASAANEVEKNVTKQALLEFFLKNETLFTDADIAKASRVWVMQDIDPETGTARLDENNMPITYSTYAQPTATQYESDKKTWDEINKTERKISENLKSIRNFKKIADNEELADVVRGFAQRSIEDLEAKNSDLAKEVEALKQKLYILKGVSAQSIPMRTKNEREQNKVYVMKDGQQYVLQFTDEKIARAINEDYNDYSNKLNKYDQKGRAATRYISASLTQYNPEFAARNFSRDFQVALATTLAERGVKEAGNFLKHFALAQRSVIAFVNADRIAEKTRYKGDLVKINIPKLDEDGNVIGTNSMTYAELLKEYFDNGAQTGYSFLKGVDSIKKDFNKLLTETKAGKWTKNITLGTLSVLTEISETSVRFAAYCAARESGMSPTGAAYLSKEVSTNFDRKGENANSPLFAYFSFLRPAINGTLKFFTAFKKYPATYTAIAVVYTALGFLFSSNDPDDDEWFSDYIRESNFVVGGVKIPVAHFMRMFYAIGVNARDYINGDSTFEKSVFNTLDFISSEILPNFLSVVSATNWFDYNEATDSLDLNYKKAIRSLAPNIISPFVDVIINQDFMGRRTNGVNDELPWNKNKKDVLKYNKRTPQWVIDAVQGVYSELAKGNLNIEDKRFDNFIQDKFDVSPSNVEHVVKGYIPAAVDFVYTLGALVYNAAKGNEITAKDIPFIRSAMQTYDPEKVYRQQMYVLSARTDSYNEMLKIARKQDREVYDEMIQSEQYRVYEQSRKFVNQNKKTSVNDNVLKQTINLNREWNKLH